LRPSFEYSEFGLCYLLYKIQIVEIVNPPYKSIPSRPSHLVDLLLLLNSTLSQTKNQVVEYRKNGGILLKMNVVRTDRSLLSLLFSRPVVV